MENYMVEELVSKVWWLEFSILIQWIAIVALALRKKNK